MVEFDHGLEAKAGRGWMGCEVFSEELIAIDVLPEWMQDAARSAQGNWSVDAKRFVDGWGVVFAGGLL